MTIHFNVTDAIGSAPNHGITRTERRLAVELAGRPDVSFVSVSGGRARRVGDEEVLRAVETEPGDVPMVERFGVDKPRPDARRDLRTLARRALRGRGPVTAFEPVRFGSGDVLVSVGLDWMRGVVDVGRQLVYGAGGRYIGFCYDLIPIDHPEWLFPPDPDGFRRHLQSVVDVASLMVCISENTRQDLLRHFPDLDPANVAVLRLGADAAVGGGSEHEAFAASLFDGEPFALYCATLDRRKNHQLLYRVVRRWARDGRRGNIAFVGRRGSGVDDLIDCLRHDTSVAGRVAHVTDCDDEHLAALYRRAEVAVYPSLYEGWGLGVTEALAHGTPCIIATGSSLEEAGLGACEALHPLRTEPWADLIADHLEHPRTLPALDLPTWEGAASDLLRLAAP